MRAAPVVGTFGGLSPALMHELRAAAEWRSNKLTSSEYTSQGISLIMRNLLIVNS